MYNSFSWNWTKSAINDDGMFVAWRVNEVLSIQIEWPNSRGSHTHLRVSALTQSLVSQGKSILILTCAYLRGVGFQEL
jgi:hypothetical protein